MNKYRILVCLAATLSTGLVNPVLAQDFNSSEVVKIRTELNQSKNFNKALDQLQELLKKEPNNAEAHMLCGKVLQKLGYEGLADQEYKTADKLDPTQPKSILALFHNKLQTEGPVAANEYMQYVQNRFPYDPSVLIMQGLLARLHGQDLQAEYFYNLAMERHPNTPGVASALASLRISQERYKDAINLADADLKLNKDHPVANLAKGQALLLKGEPALAIPCLQTACKVSADKKLASDLLSRAYLSNGEYGEAIEPTLTCMAWTSSKDKPAIDQLKRRLRLILQKSAPSELINTLEVTRRQLANPEQIATIYFASGDVLDICGHRQEAATAFTEGLKYHPFAGRAYLRLGILKEKQRDYAAAFKDYYRAHELSNDDREVAARFLRLMLRSRVQPNDLAWQLKDMLYGGRISKCPLLAQ